VRRKRIYGDNVTSMIDDRAEESIVARLTKLLAALDKVHPAQGWGRYLKDGKPDWSQIAVSGLSQGAGMAAYIAQRTAWMQAGNIERAKYGKLVYTYVGGKLKVVNKYGNPHNTKIKPGYVLHSGPLL